MWRWEFFFFLCTFFLAVFFLYFLSYTGEGGNCKGIENGLLVYCSWNLVDVLYRGLLGFVGDFVGDLSAVEFDSATCQRWYTQTAQTDQAA
jgi:hypothetical protein